jgi:lipid A 3-O-deacylase
MMAVPAVLALLLAALPARAGTTGSIYDMNRFLNEPPPFAATPPPPPVAPARTVRSRAQTSPPVVASPAAPRQGSAVGKIFSEVRFGLLWHDEGPFSRRKEEGVDGNIEILFASPRWLDIIWSPRPHIGGSFNSAGDTNQAYLGLTWDWSFWQGMFAEFSLGGAIHDGETDQGTAPLDRKELGCPVLFRESIGIGWRFQNRHSISLQLDHISNAKLCDTNEGLESVGVRYGYMF